MRIGRLNVVFKSDIVTKICVVQEITRPQKLAIEKWALDEALTQGLHVPRVLSYYRNSASQEILELERLPGKSLTYKQSDLSGQAFADIGSQLVSRKSKYTGFGWIDPANSRGVFEGWPQFLEDFTGKYGRQICDKGVISQMELNAILKCLQSSSCLNLAGSSLVHRDIKPGNVIWDGQRAYLIDWENVILGDPMFDLALYLARFGTDHHWQAMSAAFKELDSWRLLVYQVVALIGLTDFCLTHGFGIKQKTRKLKALLRKLR